MRLTSKNILECCCSQCFLTMLSNKVRRRLLRAVFLRILLTPLKEFFQTYIYTEQAHIYTNQLWGISISYMFISCSVTFTCQKQQLFPVLTYRIRQNALTYIHVHLYINVLFPRYNAYCMQLFARCSSAALHQPEKELNPSPPPSAVDEPQFF